MYNGMWFNDPRDTAVKRTSNQSFKILNGYENIGRNILIKIFLFQKDSRTRGHKVTLVNDQKRLDMRR